MLEKLTKAKKLEKAKELFTDAVNSDTHWQTLARDDFNFRDGEQWTQEERQIMWEEMRPVLTFNLTKSSIDLIMGMSEENKMVHRATPVDPTDAFLAEVLNDVIEWTRDNEEFADEEDAALESAAICGRGYIGIDFVPDPDRFGEITMQEIVIPVREVHFDPAARRPDISDAGYICWDRWLTKEDFKMKYPKLSKKKMDEITEASDSLGVPSGTPLDPYSMVDPDIEFASDDSDYDRRLDFRFFDKNRNMVRVVHMEYWEVYQRYFMWNPETNKFEELPADAKLKVVKDAFKEEFGMEATIEALTDKRVRWLQFTGEEVLYDEVSPLPYRGFSIVPMFAFKDVSMRTPDHFGIVRLMKDPQREINKRWSQSLNMLNQQVQPGVYAETDAFVDDRQAEQSMKEAGAITWTNAGALTAGRIKERTVPDFPSAPMQMEQFSQDIMKKITGINPDLLGQDRGRQEPGVVVRLRQQQGMTLLKPLFRSFNRMKKQLFKRQLAIIMEYMPDEQFLRILGQSDRYVIDENGNIADQQTGQVAEIRDVRNLEYNISGEEAPGNMSKRMMELQTMMEMQAAGMPVPPELIIEKMDVSATDKASWLQFIQQSNEQASAQQEEMVQKETAFKEKELSLQEQKIINDFILGMAKINQMADKDAKKMQQSVMSMSLQEQRDFLTYVQQMASVAQQAQGEQLKAETDRAGRGADIGMRLMEMSMQPDKEERSEQGQRAKK